VTLKLTPQKTVNGDVEYVSGEFTLRREFVEGHRMSVVWVLRKNLKRIDYSAELSAILARNGLTT